MAILPLFMGQIEKDIKGFEFELKPWQCPICRKNDEAFIGYRGGSHHRYKYGITSRVVQCRGCGLIYSNPFPIPRNPQELYGEPQDYFSGHDEQAKILLNRDIIRKLIQLCHNRPRLIDIGSGRGEMLAAAKQEGVEAVGLEFSDAMIASAKERHQVDVFKKSIEQAAKDWPGQFDAVILNAVLEHVYDPDSMIKSVSELLRAGGVVYVDIPNEPSLFTIIGNLMGRLFGTRTVYNLSPTWSPYHVYGFNPRALAVLFQKYGLEIIDLRIRANPKIKATGGLKDRVLSWIGSIIKFIANLTGTANNMYVWARKK